MSGFWAFSWILIPIAGILAGAFKEWLQFKQTQNQLGTSTEQLEKKVEMLERALEVSEGNRNQLTERIQNLETIVTSTEWDSLEEYQIEDKAKLSAKANKTPSLLAEDVPLKQDASQRMNKAAQIAKRLNT